MSDFDTFWKVFPHWATRSNKAQSKAIFTAITETAGHIASTKVEGTTIKMNLSDTPENIIAGAKAYRMMLTEEKWAKGAQVFLNQGCWMIDDAVEIAERFDRIQIKAKELMERGNVHRLS
jgi:hypothetical protein